MNTTAILVSVLGLGLVGGAVLLVNRSPLPGEGKLEGENPDIPKHAGVGGPNTKLQLLAAYDADLKKAQGLAAQLERELRSLESQASTPCDAYAQNPRYEYRCNGFPVCGWNEWHDLTGSSQDAQLFHQCNLYVKGVGSLSSRSLELRGEHNRAAWNALGEKVRSGQAQAGELRRQYLATKQSLDNARNEVSRIQKLIADLEARGVY